ncbi:MAG: anti-sigma factor domain-containing protein [Myxococcota bacterium]
MSAAAPQERGRLFELMADAATEGLAEPDRDELATLSRRHPEVDPLALDLTAAALDLALSVAPAEPLPSHLRQRVEDDARAFFVGARIARQPAARRRRERPGRRGPRPAGSRSRSRSRSRWLASTAAVGWGVAAAALVLVWSRGPLGSAPTPPAAAPAAVRASFLATAPDVSTLEWTATGDAAGPRATGDVVWSEALQQGFMRFRGLSPNDPTVSQYQLWIFDAARDERHPVDGGVFDIAPGQDEVVVPIRARLPISQAVLFAVTVEQPGGVVVSSRERLPLLARASL